MSETQQSGREIEIDHIGARGDGVAEGPLFVPFALPGERVRADVDGDRGRLLDVVVPSPDRVEPPCAHFGVCGGCALQHWALPAYRRWKRNLVAEQLLRTGVDADISDVIDATASGRRRATLHAVRAAAVGFVFGFSEPNSNRVFDLKTCPVLSPGLASALDGLKRLAETRLGRPGRVDVHVAETDAGLDVSARGGGKLGASARNDLARLAAEADWARLTVGDELIAQRRAPEAVFGAASVRLPVEAFLQATKDGEAALARLVGVGVGKAKHVADLYAGVGTFSLRLAVNADVTAFEGDPLAVAALRDAVKRSEGLKPVAARRRDLAREPVSARELRAFDAVVLDPPRAGAREQCAQLAKSSVPRVVMASCNPATFARDARTLVDGGYRLTGVTPVDQFLWAPHVEIVGSFSR